MKLKDFRTLKHSYSSHYLQASQTIATAIFEDGSSFTGVYDSSNGHWLEMTADGLQEVGYLTDMRLNGVNKRVITITEFNPRPDLA